MFNIYRHTLPDPHHTGLCRLLQGDRGALWDRFEIVGGQGGRGEQEEGGEDRGDELLGRPIREETTHRRSGMFAIVVLGCEAYNP